MPGVLLLPVMITPGMMNSAVSANQSRSDVNFLLKDSSDAINCVFYQIVSSFVDSLSYTLCQVCNEMW